MNYFLSVWRWGGLEISTFPCRCLNLSVPSEFVANCFISTLTASFLGGSGCSYCVRGHVEPMICSTSYGFSGSLIKTPFEQQRVSQYSGLRCTLVNLFNCRHLMFSLCAQLCLAAVIILFVVCSLSNSQKLHPASSTITHKRAQGTHTWMMGSAK